MGSKISCSYVLSLHWLSSFPIFPFLFISQFLFLLTLISFVALFYISHLKDLSALISIGCRIWVGDAYSVTDFDLQVLPRWKWGFFNNCRFSFEVTSSSHKTSCWLEGYWIQSYISYGKTSWRELLPSRHGQNGRIKSVLCFIRRLCFATRIFRLEYGTGFAVFFYACSFHPAWKLISSLSGRSLSCGRIV